MHGKEINKNCQEALELKTWILEHSDVLHNIWEDPSYEDTSPLGDKCIQIDPLVGRESDFIRVTQKYGRDGMYSWDNGDTYAGHMVEGEREGWGVVTSEQAGLEMLSGEWVGGRLEGYGRMVTTRDTEITQAWFRGGCLHGYVRKMIVKKFRTFTQIVSWLGRYHSGVARGYCWQWQEGGGYLAGQVDCDGKFSGDNIAFVYPDFCTAIVGRYHDGVLVEGRSATIDTVTVVDDIAVVTWTVANDSPGVGYFKSTEESVGPHPLVSDPYEDKTVEVRGSGVGGGGEGLYARRNLVKGEIVAFYNGIRMVPKFGRNECWETSGYKIFTNTDEVWGERIDLPGDLVKLENYCATLGHKINHSFDYNSTEWFFQHPRHGLIPCVITIQNVEANSELFLHYGYDPRNCPDWYGVILQEFMNENPELDILEAADPKRLEKQEQPSWKEKSALDIC